MSKDARASLNAALMESRAFFAWMSALLEADPLSTWHALITGAFWYEDLSSPLHNINFNFNFNFNLDFIITYWLALQRVMSKTVSCGQVDVMGGLSLGGSRIMLMRDVWEIGSRDMLSISAIFQVQIGVNQQRLS
ncbi:uncharacterized protein CLUP02_13839 [Colletotrichum lupini]|uniref:Uncharacterized protein n=1 Tax=Colletotrichum lupini TaxID=145971 RepID=A0A9Q8T535_9PEZI|nr:uncharacterized protein CLUP02_13839 [Colletotrichum lupini]UQC88316.1 hypothetical protein CLUP02_13839 [Colletotrichum lupini]